MVGPARAATATWRPTGPKTRPFRFGAGGGSTGGDPALAPGARVGPYRILGTLGEGGMGRVYDAEAGEAGGPRVALKVLRRDRGPLEGDDIARFRQEAKAAARVGHPSIVRVIELGELPDHTLYLAMERLYGRSLEDWLEAPGRLRDGLGWLAEIARGLHEAHAAGVLHRDVKPANLFLHVDPRDPLARVRAKILDFGIAKVVTADATRIETHAGTLLGTPYYLAPERALGRSLDGRADLYSLGVILYEVLTGLVPFEDETFMGILAQHIRAQPLDPRQAAPDRPLPPGVCMLTMRLLAKDPSERPPHGAAVADELEALLWHEAAAIDAVVTGPRQAPAQGDETRRLDDVAERPTAAPVDAGVPGGTVSATSLVAASGLGVTASASSMGVPAGLGAAASAASMVAPRGAGASSTGLAGRPRPSPTAARWSLAVVGGVAMAGVAGAVAWVTLGGRAAIDPPAAEAAEALEEAAPAPEPAVDPDDGAAPDEGEAGPSAPVGAGSDPTAQPGPRPPTEPADDPKTGPSDAPGPEPVAPTPSRTDGDRTIPKAKRPRPKPVAPPPPAFKDDDLED